MSTLLILSQIITNRNCITMYIKNKKLLYKKQNINCIILYKRLIKLRTIIVFKKVFKQVQINIKKSSKI